MVSTSGRIVVVSVLMLQLLLIAHYNSDLISALAAGPSLPRINSVTDVNSNPSLGVGWRRGSSLEELFRESPSPAHRKVWEKIVTNDMESLVPSLEEGVKRVLQEPYLYISADISIYHTFGTDCRVFILPSSEFPIQRSLALKKDSPLIPLFNSVILDMWVFGLINKWKVTWTPPISDCNQLVVTSVDLKTVATPFILLGLATALSLALLLLERRYCPL
nr:uncharacterized protein LOC123765680 [Procambarus clarkii]